MSSSVRSGHAPSNLSMTTLPDDDNSDAMSVASNSSIKWDETSSIESGGIDQARRHMRRRMELEDQRLRVHRRKEEMGRTTKLLGMSLLVALFCFSTVRINHQSNRNMSLSTRVQKVPSSGDSSSSIRFSIIGRPSDLPSINHERETSKSSFAHLPEMTQEQKVQLNLRGIVNVTLPRNVTPSDVPFFLHIPRSGGSTIQSIFGTCFGVTQAADLGSRSGQDLSSSEQRQQELSNGDGGSSSMNRAPFLEVVHSEEGAAFVNVDLSTTEGIERARQLGLVESGMADIVFSSNLHQVAGLFTEEQPGRLFTLLRHPIDRAVSHFHHLAVADGDEDYDPYLSLVSMEMYARSNRAQPNYLVRLLSNEFERDVTQEHLDIAKRVLREKTLVGLLEEKAESMRRFQDYLGLEPITPAQKKCRDKLLHWGWPSHHAHPQVEAGSTIWDLLAKKNALDLELYQFAVDLFNDQARLFAQ